jgi:hypothetical protein
MKKLLLSILTLMLFIFISHGQSSHVILTIQKLGEPITDTLDDGTIITFDTSSDDAEQENDEMDALYDDDIDAGWEGDPEDQNILTAGLRFTNVSVPKGAVIDSAFCILHSHEGKTAEDVARITIVGNDVDDAVTFGLDQLITDRPQTTASVLWECAEDWELWQPYRTADIKSVIQEIVDRPGWRPGNALALILKGENQGPSTVENAREWESFENIADPEDGGDGKNHPERRPQLVIYYSFETSVLVIPIVKLGEPITDTLDDGTIITFDTSSDDAEQENDEMDALYDDDIDAGWEGDPEDQNILVAGLRFQNLPIPQGSEIDSAYIVVHSHEGKTAEDVARITIVGQASDNAATFDLQSLITDRPETQASLLWEVAEDWELWQPYRTPDLSQIIEEIVARPGWAPGNALAFMLKGENQGPSTVENAREWESFENISDPEDGGDGKNHPERVPKLYIYYKGPLAIAERPENLPLHVYPNPANSSQVYVTLKSDDPAQVSVYDLTGKEIYSRSVDRTTVVEVNINELNTGLYILKAIQQGRVYTQKLVVNQ